MAEPAEELKDFERDEKENSEIPEPKYLDLAEKPEDKAEVQVDAVEPGEDFSFKKEDLEYLTSDKTWVEVGVPEKFMKNIENSGFVKPSQIQASTLPMILVRKPPITLMAQSKNGSGKTLCFALPSVILIDESIDIKKGSLLSPQTIILVPTFELILQVANVINSKILKSKFPKIKIDKIVDQKKDSQHEGGHLLIGTPKSINGLLRHNEEKMTLENLKLLSIDEADHIFMNEQERTELNKMLRKLKASTSLVMFSATFPQDSLDKIAELKRKNFIKLTIGKKEDLTLKNVHQFYFDVPLPENLSKNPIEKTLKKNQTIGAIFREVVKNQSIIFVNSKRYAESLMYYLRDIEKHSVGLIMGFPMTKEEREFVINKFSNKEFEILITTNLLSRGIDMRAVNLIVNADLPEVYETKMPDYETYLHRIGRTGRFGDIGLALNLVDGPNTRNLVESFKKFYSCEIGHLKDLKQLPGYIANIREENEKKREDLKEDLQEKK